MGKNIHWELCKKLKFHNTDKWHLHKPGFVCGVYGLRSGAMGKAVLDIWLHILVILFYPTLVSRCNALPKKVPKRIIRKKRQQQIRNEGVSLILSFIYWVQQPFRGWGSFSWIHWNGWMPQLRCQNTWIRFMYVGVRIWYFGLPYGLVFFWKFCQSPVRVSL